ncbi:MAG: preprotein translocase subunit SecE [Eubacteriales bacterium]|nr:preprotein translocase subunit SecE [Eubacteriales bacterium]
MANVKKAAAKAATKPEKKNKKQQKKSFGAVFHKIGRFFREVVSEMKKVSWPTRKDFLTYSLAVFVFVIIMTAIVFTMDTGLTVLLNKILGT